MSGGKGGSSTSTTSIPEWLEDPAKRALARAESVADIGYAPYYGPEVASFSPMQNAAFGNTQDAASAFGMQTGAGNYMPQEQLTAGGVRGYSSAGGYNQALDKLQQFQPERFDAINGGFMKAGDPYNSLGGLREMPPASTFGGPNHTGDAYDDRQNALSVGVPAAAPGFFGGEGQGGGFGGATIGGYTGFGDMFDGGGPGVSGGAYKGGGLLSSAANAVRGR